MTEDFWKTRSKNYNELDWVKDNTYLDRIINAAKLRKTDVVLDVGTGTGIITNSIAPHVKKVVSLDNNASMAKKNTWPKNAEFTLQDIRTAKYPASTFNKIIARMVFHHITTDTQKAMDQCFRMLTPRGRCIIAEGIPPNEDCKQHYTDVFRLKEDRIVFMPQDLIDLMRNAGFRHVQVITLTLPLSITNWLENSGLPHDACDRIKQLYINAPKHVKDAYTMRTTKKGDIVLRKTKNLILIGTP